MSFPHNFGFITFKLIFSSISPLNNCFNVILFLLSLSLSFPNLIFPNFISKSGFFIFKCIFGFFISVVFSIFMLILGIFPPILIFVSTSGLLILALRE